jgi:hypothetical protein
VGQGEITLISQSLLVHGHVSFRIGGESTAVRLSTYFNIADLIDAAQKHGLATNTGTISSVGLGGVTLVEAMDLSWESMV